MSKKPSKDHHHHEKREKAKKEELTQLINPDNCEEFMKHLHNEEHDHDHDHGHGHGHGHDHDHGHGHGHGHDHVHGHDHDHSHVPKSTWRLITMICLNVAFLLAELITGFITHSLALQSDAFHMISDEASLVVGLASHKLAKRPPSKTMTFGWARMEVIGGLVNSVFLLAVCLMLFFDAIERFVDPPEIEQGILFLVVGGLGLLVNIIGMFIFHDHSHSDNMKGVFLHVMGDFFGSIGVVISACVINFTTWEYRMYVDPVISLIIVIILVHGSWGLFMRTVKICIERVPETIDTEKITEQLLLIPNLQTVHELHIWELSRNNYIALLHIVVESKEQNQKVLEMVHNLMLAFKIYSTTVQIEFVEDFPPQFSDTTNSCFYASSVGKDKRVFISKPVYQHSIGCPHYADPNGHDEHDHDHDHDHDHHDHDHDHDHHDHDHDHDHDHGKKDKKGKKDAKNKKHDHDHDHDHKEEKKPKQVEKKESKVEPVHIHEESSSSSKHDHSHDHDQSDSSSSSSSTTSTSTSTV
ncbi:cation diffusion facilitator family transporter containing protein [Tritrichomonas foetus]|uniref:Cation diffusion facilitator family transporter containing protein n=1 Tax=Tritrichomonas foetus TaxID=1144522 RepID=A0A1J4KQD7_9EUKA|nr:cation diffusion facilitator family transporter containing protein [Tritrichomonas foetus]|eukprot:OHT11902.1 cation diffusion facilitator family transporter containing protein [Tritrichomonas foetus]